ncbi:MAG: MarR family transcriptional regulator [Aldersonia sp.]|nr:MarR family transcriptional regulator [Aldersonia sp.]
MWADAEEVRSPAHALHSEATQLREAMAALTRQLRRHRFHAELTPSQLQILADVQRSGVTVPVEIANRMGIRVQSLTLSLNVLEERGLVVRRTDPSDRRRQLVELTDDGNELIRRDRAERDAWLEAAMAANLSELERGVLKLAAPILVKLATSEVHAAIEDPAD